jgi:3-oxoacyl-(acyl-carrier-protein) synthase
MRIVVTGMGAVTGFGYGIGALADGLFDRRSSVRKNTLFAELDGRPSPAAFVEDVPDSAASRSDHFIRSSVGEAIRQAGLSIPLPSLGIFVATLHGNLDSWCQAHEHNRQPHPDLWDLGTDLWPTLAERHVLTTITTGCTSSAFAAGQCMDYLRAGLGEVGLVAAAEGLTPFVLEGFKALRSIASDNCRPFDADRTGLVVGEGGAALVLETLEHAERRGAVPLAEIAGYGASSDGTGFTAPASNGEGASRALLAALRDAVAKGPPDSVNAHGTGTKHGDRAECVALERVFGADVKRIAVTSSKPAVGHLFGAAGGIELICSILGMGRDLITPILTFERPDEEFRHFDFVHGDCRNVRQNMIISMNSAFGGTNSAVVLKRI